jgi:tetratricopeptide (TPR) repeat protein
MNLRHGFGQFLLLGLILSCLGVLLPARGAQASSIAVLTPDSAVTTPGSNVTIHGSGFLPDSVVYFGGLQVRVTTFISPNTLEVVTPYLRPGAYRLQVKSGGITVRSQVTFTASPAQIDSEIDHAVGLAKKDQTPAAIDILTAIAKTNGDYQVRAFAYYQIGQIYFAKGDWWRWGESSLTFLDSDKSGPAVWTSWRYRLTNEQADYFLPTNNDPDHDVKMADWTVEYDVTENPEPRFYRGLVNARCGNLEKAKADSDFILKLEPGNPSYRALAAYIAGLAGDKTQLPSFSGETITDARALSLLGETAYLNGDVGSAQSWWTQAAKVYPLGASLAYWAGKKHMARGQKRVAEALLTECTIMAPNSKEAKEAKDLLITLEASPTN